MGQKRFKIKTQGEPHFFWCRVFDTKKEMHQWYRTTSQYQEQGGKGDFGAMVLPYEKVKFENDAEIRHPEIGTVIFYRGQMGAGVISHEMGHCALWYDRIINGNRNAQYGEEVNDEEERLCYLIGDLTRCLVNKCYKLNIF